MIVKLLTEHHLKFVSLKGGCRGSSESTIVKMSNCWKSHALAHIYKNVKAVLWHSVCEFHINRHRYSCFWSCTPVCPLYVCVCVNNVYIWDP